MRYLLTTNAMQFMIATTDTNSLKAKFTLTGSTVDENCKWVLSSDLNLWVIMHRLTLIAEARLL
jgi:hypothetical protein